MLTEVYLEYGAMQVLDFNRLKEVARPKGASF